MKLLLTTFCLLLITGSSFAADTSGYFGYTASGGTFVTTINNIYGVKITANAGIDVEVDSIDVGMKITWNGSDNTNSTCVIYHYEDSSLLLRTDTISWTSQPSNLNGDNYQWWTFNLSTGEDTTLKNDTSYILCVFSGGGIGSNAQPKTNEVGGAERYHNTHSWAFGLPDPLDAGTKVADSVISIKVFWHGTVADPSGAQIIIIGYVDGLGNWTVTDRRSDIWRYDDP